MIFSTSDQGNRGLPPARRKAMRATELTLERGRDAVHIRRFLAGDESAFAEIMRLHRGKVFAIAVSVVRNSADAEEIVQDTFLRAHRGLAAFRGDSALATWLRHIAFNLARNRYWYFHRRHRHNARSLEAPVGEDGATTFAGLIADSAPDPAREVAQREFLDHVMACMHRLTVGQREILNLRNLLDLSYDDIGTRLGISLGTVKSRIARARGSLRRGLGDAYPVQPRECPDFARWFDTSRAEGQLIAVTC